MAPEGASQRLAAYPRGEAPFEGTAEGLQAAVDAFSGLGVVGICSLFGWILMLILAAKVSPFTLLATIPCLGFVTSKMTYLCARKVAIASRRPESFAGPPSIVTGLLSPFGLSIFILACLQGNAQQELRRYGVWRAGRVQPSSLKEALWQLSNNGDRPADLAQSYVNKPVPNSPSTLDARTKRQA